MKFGKEFRTHLEETLPEWRDKFLRYKPLKKLLKQFPVTPDVLVAAAAAAAAADHHHLHHFLVDNAAIDGAKTNRPCIDLEEWFVRILNEELEKFNDFYVDKEEEFVIRLQELKERIERVEEKSNIGGAFTSQGEFSEEMLDIRKDFVTIHGEMVLLKNYSSLNFAGLVKILKKYDKRTGGLLRLPFTQRALNQPFFTTEPLTRLVRECEANLEVLFPLEAEVIETTPTDHTELQREDITNAPTEASSSSSLGEDAVDVYRCTLAAMRTIQGLRKASSTYNPLSFASLFQSQDDDTGGAITVENSDSNTSTTLQNEETEEEDAHSTK